MSGSTVSVKLYENQARQPWSRRSRSLLPAHAVMVTRTSLGVGRTQADERAARLAWSLPMAGRATCAGPPTCWIS